ncbi:ATP-binding cassette domain-containing protein [Fluviispira vulneris]|uniref:ATP-binding cassette domain-containing protein n=1 Tax=Fluviispira vulneris TaxID=2763012 RepID=UPI0016488B1C|nr:ABC transporter ATP-binding protein [Fluviispira vulneris]
MRKIILKNISFNYKSGDFILKNISEELDCQGITAVIGRNGAGKSTFFNLILRNTAPSSGEIIFTDKKMKSIFMAQNISAPWKLTCQEVFEFIYSLNSESFKTTNFRNFLDDEFSLSKWEKIKKRRFGLCSNGEKSWFMANIILNLENDVYFLDEPTAGIDPESRILIWNKIKKTVEKGKGVFISSHLLDEIAQYAGKIILIHNASVYQYDNIEAFKLKHGSHSVDSAFMNAISG